MISIRLRFLYRRLSYLMALLRDFRPGRLQLHAGLRVLHILLRDFGPGILQLHAGLRALDHDPLLSLLSFIS